MNEPFGQPKTHIYSFPCSRVCAKCFTCVSSSSTPWVGRPRLGDRRQFPRIRSTAPWLPHLALHHHPDSPTETPKPESADDAGTESCLPAAHVAPLDTVSPCMLQGWSLRCDMDTNMTHLIGEESSVPPGFTERTSQESTLPRLLAEAALRLWG